MGFYLCADEFGVWSHFIASQPVVGLLFANSDGSGDQKRLRRGGHLFRRRRAFDETRLGQNLAPIRAQSGEFGGDTSHSGRLFYWPIERLVVIVIHGCLVDFVVAITPIVCLELGVEHQLRLGINLVNRSETHGA